MWRRRESNTGPAETLEGVGASCGVVSGLKSGVCGDAGGVASAAENRPESGRCSNVASGKMLAEVLEAVEGALRALDAGEVDTAAGRLLALAAAVRITCHVPDEHGV